MKTADPEVNGLALTRQRSLFIAIALSSLVVSFAVSLPRAVKRRNELKAANGAVLHLQSDLLALQQREKEVMANIVKAQAEITLMQTKTRE